MNSVKLYGRLTKGPTIKTGDTTKAYITLAVSRPWKNKETGEYEADFPNIVFYKSTDYIQKYCRKGSRAIVEGRIRTFLTNENGQNIKNMQIVGSNITLIDYPQNGRTITYTKGDGSTGTITTQDTDTTYSAGNGVSLSGTTFSAKAGTNVTVNSNGISVTGNGTVASGNTGLIDGGKLYAEVRPSDNGNYVRTTNTTAANLIALDTQTKMNY